MVSRSVRALARALVFFSLLANPTVLLAQERRTDVPEVEATATPPKSEPKMETVVTATRYEAPIDHLGASITVFGEHDIDARQATSVADLLREVPGLAVVQSGGPGATTALFSRGTNANHTLVLIDGMEAMDPSSIDGAFDFADLPADNLERIEVLRGPASSLYGSDALGGVVHLVSKRGNQGGPTFTLRSELGSFQTHRTTASLSGAGGWGDYSVSAGFLGTRGISIAASRTGDTEPDGYERLNVSGRARVDLPKPWELTAAFRLIRSRADLDDFGNGAIDDPNYIQLRQKLLVRPEVALNLLDGRVRSALAVTYGADRLLTENPPQLGADASSSAHYSGTRLQLSWLNELRLHDTNRGVVLLEWERTSAEANSLFDTPPYGISESTLASTELANVAVMVQDSQRLWNRLTLTGSVRLDVHDAFGNAFTHAAHLVYAIPVSGTVLRIGEAAGFRAPSISQLHDPMFGNPDLQAERSQSFEAGVEQHLITRQVALGVTGYLTRVRALIGFDPGSLRSVNIRSAFLRGVEAFGRLDGGAVRARVDLGYVVPTDEETLEDLLRRPRIKAGAGLELAPLTNTTLTVRLDYIGHRADTDFGVFPARRALLPGYLLGFVGASFRVNPSVVVHARVENALNQRYEEVLSFGAPGISAYGGVRVEL